CLSPVQRFYDYQKQIGNTVLVCVNNLEGHYVEEYLIKVIGMKGISRDDILPSEKALALGGQPAKEHIVAGIKIGKTFFQKTCVAYFDQNVYPSQGNADIDSLPPIGDYSGFKYKGLHARKVDSNRYPL